MKNFSTASDSGVNAQNHFPGHAMQSANDSESLSDDFNEALVSWIGRIDASGGSRIGKSRFAAHDGAVSTRTDTHPSSLYSFFCKDRHSQCF